MKWVLSYCGAKSARIHSHYVRTFQDLPIQHMKTIVVLNNRKLFCDNQDCAYRTFAEPFGFIKPKFKKTDRLIEEIINQISEVLGLETNPS